MLGVIPRRYSGGLPGPSWIIAFFCPSALFCWPLNASYRYRCNMCLCAHEMLLEDALAQARCRKHRDDPFSHTATSPTVVGEVAVCS
jgi:hypothetical protein